MNFDDRLAPYAAHSAQGRGRQFAEAPAALAAKVGSITAAA